MSTRDCVGDYATSDSWKCDGPGASAVRLVRSMRLDRWIVAVGE
jgi:hypothetical protein